jgi:hypothetical protein
MQMRLRFGIVVGVVALGLTIGFLYLNHNEERSADITRAAEQTNPESRLETALAASGEETTHASTEHVLPEVFASVAPDPDNLYPELPTEVYARNIEAANEGDAGAMYWVSKSLRDCSDAPRSEEQYQENVASRSEQQPWWEYFRFKMERCRSLFELIGEGEDIDGRARYWLEQSAMAGNRTAKVEVMLNDAQFGRPPVDNPQVRTEIKSLVYEDVKTKTYPAYYQMARYLEWLSDGSTLESTAWNYAACRLHPGCDVDSARRLLEVQHYPYEAEEIMRLVDNIEKDAATPVTNGG